jgi:hypothetical protein
LFFPDVLICFWRRQRNNRVQDESRKKESNAQYFYLFVTYQPRQWICITRPEYLHVAVINRINHHVKPDAKNAGYNHFPETSLVGYAKNSHYFFKEMPQRIRCNTPDGTDCRTNQKGMKMSVRRPMMIKQNLDINDDVSKDEYRDVKPLSKNQPNKTTGTEMIWRKRHKNLSSKSRKGCLWHGIAITADNNGYTPLKYLLFCR